MLTRRCLLRETILLAFINLLSGLAALLLARKLAECITICAAPVGERRLRIASYARCADIWSRLRSFSLAGGVRDGSWVVCNGPIVLVGRDDQGTYRFRVFVLGPGAG